MSIQDERELRDRLTGLLGALEPALPPVVRTMRRGRGIKMRRWVSAAAGLAVIAAGATVIPLLLQHRNAAPLVRSHYKVTVTRLGPAARAGVIGAGTIDNKRWRVVVNKAGGDGCIPRRYLLICGLAYSGTVGRRDVSLNSVSANGTQFQIGIVGSGVTRVVVLLGNGTQLDVRPVAAGGYRWVAFAAPQLTMKGAASFVGGSEHMHAVPYVSGTTTEFVTWLRPGQLGLPRVTRQVGSGELDGVSWHASVDVGPWGYCAAFTSGGECFATTVSSQLLSAGSIMSALSCGPLYTSGGKATGATSGVMAVPQGVKDVVLKFADGSQQRMVTVPAAGIRVLGFAIPNEPKVVQALEYGFAGQLMGSPSGGIWRC